MTHKSKHYTKNQSVIEESMNTEGLKNNIGIKEALLDVADDPVITCHAHFSDSYLT